jgi:hypothetical protein
MNVRVAEGSLMMKHSLNIHEYARRCFRPRGRYSIVKLRDLYPMNKRNYLFKLQRRIK